MGSLIMVGVGPSGCGGDNPSPFLSMIESRSAPALFFVTLSGIIMFSVSLSPNLPVWMCGLMAQCFPLLVILGDPAGGPMASEISKESSFPPFQGVDAASALALDVSFWTMTQRMIITSLLVEGILLPLSENPFLVPSMNSSFTSDRSPLLRLQHKQPILLDLSLTIFVLNVTQVPIQWMTPAWVV